MTFAGNKIEDVYMSLKVDDVPVKGKNKSSKVEEYEEYTARPDGEGKMKDIETRLYQMKLYKKELCSKMTILILVKQTAVVLVLKVVNLF